MLNDSRQKEVQEFVVALSQKGHEQGFLTFDQIIDALPDSIDPGQVNDIVKRLLALGVNVCEEAPVVENENRPSSHSKVQGPIPLILPLYHSTRNLISIFIAEKRSWNLSIHL